MKHEAYNEQALILYYYDDGLSRSEKHAIAEALQADASLAKRFRELSARLNALQGEAPALAPSHLQHQWHDLIAGEAQLERQAKQPNERPKRWLGWAAGLTAMLLLGIVIGRVLQPVSIATDGATTELAATPEKPLLDAVGATAFTRAVQFYLDEQQGDLARMDEQSADNQQLLLLQIVAQNRLIERAAMANNSPDLARLMRAFEPLLLKLADQNTSPEEVLVLQRQLAFELQAVLTKLQQAPSNPAIVI